MNPVDLSKRKREAGIDPVIMNDATPTAQATFGELFDEMKNFLCDFKEGQGQKEKTVFFEQQEIVGMREDKEKKERLQLLLERQLGLPSHFHMACRVTRNQ